MMKRMVLLLCVVFFTGCLMRTYTVYKPRKNLEVTGNRGYLMGSPKEPAPENRLGDKRPISVVEFEFGPHPGASKRTVSRRVPEAPSEPIEDIIEEIDEEIEAPEAQTYEKPQELRQDYTYYTVKENDTLQKISRKFYGTTRKWQFIYEHNKGIIKNPDNVYPGTKLKIPEPNYK